MWIKLEDRSTGQETRFFEKTGFLRFQVFVEQASCLLVAKTIEANVTRQQGQVGMRILHAWLVEGPALGSSPILQVKPSNVTIVQHIVTIYNRTLVY